MSAAAVATASAPEHATLYSALASLKPLTDALSCISLPSRAHDVLLSHSAAGVRFTTSAPSHQASVLLPPSAFTQLRVTRASLQIRLNLSALQDALAVLSAADSPVELWFVDEQLVAQSVLDGSVVHVRLSALDFVHPPSLIEPTDAPEVCAFILGAEAFRDALQDLDYAGAPLVEMMFLAEPACLRLVAPAGCSEQLARLTIELGSEAAGFQAVRCEEAQGVVLAREHLLRTVRAVLAAESVKLVLNEAGVLSIVCRLRGVGSDDRSFVEFVLLTQDDEDEPPEAEQSEQL